MRDSKVLLLEDDEDLRDALAELVTRLGGRGCLPLGSVAELVEHRDEALACGLAILDINLGAGQPSGLDAHAWLQAQRFAGRTAFLTAHARSHPLVARAASLAGARVYGKPITTLELRQILDGAAEASS